MVLGTGIDVVPIDDMRHEMASGAWSSSDGIFRPSELRDCGTTLRSAQKLAAVFAIKESVVKALGLSAVHLGMFADIEVMRAESRQPSVRLHGELHEQAIRLGVARILACAHTDRNLAVAFAILED